VYTIFTAIILAAFVLPAAKFFFQGYTPFFSRPASYISEARERKKWCGFNDEKSECCKITKLSQTKLSFTQNF
jgi:hypothetical protein